MTQFEFNTLCGKYLIDVNIALESEELTELIRNKASLETIEQFLKEQAKYWAIAESNGKYLSSDGVIYNNRQEYLNYLDLI